MIRLDMNSINMKLIEKQQKYQHNHLKKYSSRKIFGKTNKETG